MNLVLLRTQAYTAWKEDKIWLPSMTEVGWQDAGARRMWNTRVSLRADTNNSEVWLRSADSSNVHDVYTLLPNATANHFQLANETGSVRPAFHLNLAKAAARSSRSNSKVPLYSHRNPFPRKQAAIFYLKSNRYFPFYFDMINCWERY